MREIQPSPLISVIVPVYNAEESIQRCLHSLTQQTYQNIEIVVVDDGSPDRSGDIAAQCAETDSRIVVIRQANGGASAARNTGIEAAKGEYLCFVDADDYVDDSYINNFAKGISPEVDMVFQGICELKGNRAFRLIPQARYYPKAAICEAIADINTLSYTLFGYVCTKLYRREIIMRHHLRFRCDISLSEDRIFALQYLHEASAGIQLIAACAYYYRILPSGLTLRARGYEELKYAAETNHRAALHLLADSPNSRFLEDTRKVYVMTAFHFLSALFIRPHADTPTEDAWLEFKAKALAWLPLAQPHTKDARILCSALRLPNAAGLALMKLYWHLKNVKTALMRLT